MALYNSFVFGELRNKLANVVAMRSRGKGVLRSNGSVTKVVGEDFFSSPTTFVISF